MLHATNNLQKAFLLLPRSGQSRLYGESVYGPARLYECQNALPDISWTLQNIQDATPETQFPTGSAIPVAALPASRKISIGQNQYYAFFLSRQFSCLLKSPVFLIWQVFHN